MKLMRAAAAALLLVGAIGVAPVAAHGTCSDVEFLAIDVHGMHVVRDYVMGGGLTEWPPKGGVVGAAVGGSGASLPGGPGPGFHFPNGIAPGASFCTDSNSPGLHL
ncbi:MAG TPA: hypothetical protein VFK35_05410 [Candidatus Limnocylindrales bacterium]|nr:hypothetical protein [Candidatus Limnocylindrales bacterium]